MVEAAFGCAGALPELGFGERRCAVRPQRRDGRPDGSPCGRREGGEVRPRRTRSSMAVWSAKDNGALRREGGKGKHVPNLRLNLAELTDRITNLLHVGSPLHYQCCSSGRPQPNEITKRVAVVFGKRLVRDQVTVEYASRVVALVKRIALDNELKPDVVCFTGGRSNGLVSEAAAGYNFFRSMCDNVSLDVTHLDFLLLESSHNTRDALSQVLQQLCRWFGSETMAQCNFTLISTDYHLFRLQEVHRLNPSRSLLRVLDQSNISWDYLFVFYPFCVSADPTLAFLGRVNILSSELSIVLVNLEAAVEDRAFLIKDNLNRLSSTVLKLRKFYDTVQRPRPTFQTDMRKCAEVIESCIMTLREVQRLLAPSYKSAAAVNRRELECARSLLAQTIQRLRIYTDPDQPLRLKDVSDFCSEIRSSLEASPAALVEARQAAPPDGSDEALVSKRGRIPPQAGGRLDEDVETEGRVKAVRGGDARAMDVHYGANGEEHGVVRGNGTLRNDESVGEHFAIDAEESAAVRNANPARKSSPTRRKRQKMKRRKSNDA